MTHPTEPFLIGCADAAHQVEGGLLNDWTVFEERHPEKIVDGARSGLACDQFHRYHEDIRLMAALGATAYRFSIEWSRVEPHEGVFDRSALAHYRDVIHTCRRYGLEPVVTLQHFTLPLWLAEQGGLLAPNVVPRFARYVATVVATIGDIVTWWVTVNEPNVLAVMGHLWGYWPPGAHSVPNAFHALRSLVRMHAAGYCAIKDGAGRRQQRTMVSFAHHERPFSPRHASNPVDRAVAVATNGLFNNWLLDACSTGKLALPVGGGTRVHGLAGSMDYIGLNYYTSEVASLHARGMLIEPLPDRPLSGNRSVIDAELFGETIRRLWATRHLPILVTENGVSDTNDALRPAYLRDHLEVIRSFRAEGVPVLGYLHWTLMDNFEWHEGYSQQFGLYSVDRTTLERIPKPSAAVFAEYCHLFSIGEERVGPSETATS